jgi:hypothetical protein
MSPTLLSKMTEMAAVQPRQAGDTWDAFVMPGTAVSEQFLLYLLLAMCFAPLFLIVGMDIHNKCRTGDFQRDMVSCGRGFLAIINPLTYWRIFAFVVCAIHNGICESQARRREREAERHGFGQGRLVMPHFDQNGSSEGSGDDDNAGEGKGKGKAATSEARDLDMGLPPPHERAIGMYDLPTKPRFIESFRQPDMIKAKSISNPRYD